MAETNSTLQNSHEPQSNSGQTTSELQERAARLREKVGDLSKTFERMERSLVETAQEGKDSSA
jgi:hypothetical protein